MDEVLTGERDKSHAAAAGEEGEDSSLAWTVRKKNTSPVALFETLNVLYRRIRDKLSAC